MTLILFYSILEFSMYLSYISYKNLNSLKARLAWLWLFFVCLQYPGYCLIFDKYLLWRWVDTLTQSSAVNKCIYTYAFPFCFHNLQWLLRSALPPLMCIINRGGVVGTRADSQTVNISALGENLAESWTRCVVLLFVHQILVLHTAIWHGWKSYSGREIPILGLWGS